MVAPVAPMVALVALPALAALAALIAWQKWNCRRVQDAVIRSTVDEVMVEEMLDDVPVPHHLVWTEALVHEMVADMLHPRREVEAEIATGRLPCVEVMVVAEPWKPMVSATACGPTRTVSSGRTVLLTASQLRREPAPKVPLNMGHPAVLVVAREYDVTTS